MFILLCIGHVQKCTMRTSVYQPTCTSENTPHDRGLMTPPPWVNDLYTYPPNRASSCRKDFTIYCLQPVCQPAYQPVCHSDCQAAPDCQPDDDEVLRPGLYGEVLSGRVHVLQICSAAALCSCLSNRGYGDSAMPCHCATACEAMPGPHPVSKYGAQSCLTGRQSSNRGSSLMASTTACPSSIASTSVISNPATSPLSSSMASTTVDLEGVRWPVPPPTIS